VAGTDTPKFQFWRFFFLLKGRVSRRAFAAFIIPEKLAVWGADEILRTFQAHTLNISLNILSLVLGLINLIFLWPKFAVSFKRLQDCGFSGNIALILFLPFLFVFWQALSIAGIALPLPAYVYSGSNILFYALWIFTLVLCAIPGTKGINRYGPPPRGPQTHAADAF